MWSNGMLMEEQWESSAGVYFIVDPGNVMMIQDSILTLFNVTCIYPSNLSHILQSSLVRLPRFKVEKHCKSKLSNPDFCTVISFHT